MPRTPSDTPKDKLTLSIDKDVKRRFDFVSKWHGLTMSHVATELFEEWLAKNTPPGLFDKEPAQKGKGQ
ncbi:hypothetical protein [Allocoleopsis franciscana]|uniref:Uncharacterized protein n=1 Tax=Allocoleopsis franciscana PCC 7113 TaxID=1173027 RepID=K9WRE5_9CYAN|nr:hypothetical protein [Allocoleopsis franciscana]AFZ22361.1 hypothetical protein Mic7113_6803 [Allocoleopsis franciscana PCC 7113]